MPFEVLVLGVGDTFSEVHYPTSLLLMHEGFHLAIDCPDMYRRVLHDAREKSGRDVRLSQIDDLLLTHVHGDHMNGLEGAGFFKHFAQGRRLRLHCAPEVHEGLWEHRLRLSMGQLYDGKTLVPKTMEHYFEHHPIPWSVPTQIGPFTITTRLTKHHVPTSALRVEAGGRILGYSCDTAFDPHLIEWLASADFIIHETNLGPAHSAAEELNCLPASLRDKMGLVHYPDPFDVDGQHIRVLREGEVLEV